MRKHVMLAAASAALISAMSAAAGAAPASNAGSVMVAAEQTSAVEKVGQRCLWRYGQKYCLFNGRRIKIVDSLYGAPRPEEIESGTSLWWRSMDREQRGGRR
jgi:hypothetical protein